MNPRTLREWCSRLSRQINRAKSPKSLQDGLTVLLDRARAADEESGSFLSFYAAIYVAWRGYPHIGRILLRPPPLSPMGQRLSGHLLENTFPAPRKQIFETGNPLEAWSQVPFNKVFNANCLKYLESRKYNAVAKKPFYILDIGPGNGIFLREVVNSLRRKKIASQFVVVLIEQSRDLLVQAQRRLAKMPCVTVQDEYSFPKRVEDLDSDDKKLISRLPLNLTMSAASLHHLSVRNKRRILRWIQSLKCDFLLFELEGNEERYSNCSVDFIYSVFSFYNALLVNIEKSSLSVKEKQSCSDEFIFAEALQVLSRPYGERQNYHALLKDWKTHVRLAHFEHVISRCLNIVPGSPRLVILDCGNRS
jgi:hypothetical protein